MKDRIKRIYGKGYENRNVIIRKRKERGDAFLFFLLLFGVTTYLLASAFFHSVRVEEAWRAISVLF